MVLAVTAAVAAVVLAVFLAGAPQGGAPLTGPTPSGTSPSATSPSAASPSATLSGEPTSPSSPSPPPSESQPPEASENPGEAPSPPPVAPGPTPPPATFPAGLVGTDVEVVPGAGPSVALTFDAGGNSAGLPAILDTLAGAGIRGTFFLTGSWATANPTGVAAIVAGGHRVGNHSQTHPSFTGLSDSAIGDQLLGAEQAIQAAGADPRPLFRFPFGARDARTVAAVNNLGYVPVR